jgi:hypothetical protein
MVFFYFIIFLNFFKIFVNKYNDRNLNKNTLNKKCIFVKKKTNDKEDFFLFNYYN